VDKLVFLTMPRAGREARVFDATRHFWHPGKVACEHMPHATSSLPMTFDQAWCHALNNRQAEYTPEIDAEVKAAAPPEFRRLMVRYRLGVVPLAGYTHFAMIHDDIVPLVPDWLDVLLAVMDEQDADVVSAVSPIKDDKGLTSTGYDTPGNPLGVRRLTMREVFALPETFTDPYLVVNTGLFVCKLGAWCRETWFQQCHGLVEMASGQLSPTMISEDWDWSRMVRKAGRRMVATRRVPLYHEHRQYHTEGVWGRWERDEDYYAWLEEVKAQGPVPGPGFEAVGVPAEAVAGVA
jgi:hypothetical protein